MGRWTPANNPTHPMRAHSWQEPASEPIGSPADAEYEIQEEGMSERYSHPDRKAAAEMVADANERAGFSAITPAEVGGLVERLRGIYRIPITDGLGAVGSGEDPDNPDEFVRKFDTPPIQHEAATALEAQAAELAAVKVSSNKWLAKWERAEAQLAEARKALGFALTGLEAGCNQCAIRTFTGTEVPGDEQLPWVRLMQIGRDAARRALTGGNNG